METDINNNKLKNNNSPQNKAQKSPKKEKKSPYKYIKFIKTNLYLNEYNYYFKNAIKMNKIREEKFKEYKQKTEIARKNNKLPKILYFNKYLNNDIRNIQNKKYINNNNLIKATNTSDSINFKTECKSSDNRSYTYKKIEKAIIAKNIEEKNKSHIKKTFKAFEDLIKYIDNVKFNNIRPDLNFVINISNEKNKSEILEDREKTDNSGEEEDDDNNLNIENYNFDEYKKQYKKEKKTKKKSNSQIHFNTYESQSQKELQNNYSENFKNIKDNIYITTSNYINKGANVNNLENKTNTQPKDLSNSFDNKGKNKNKSKKLRINKMTLISDDSLAKKIKNLGRDFKNGLYFNEYGKYKFTELGLNYPNSVDKYKKIPDYKGNDLEEKKIFKYKSLVTNPKYNYTNIGSFNEKFNHDLSDISNYYGKAYSKGRFLRNPLATKYSKYIPNYEKYKDLKSIENRYISKNKYKFRLKPLINSKKNNFDKLANNVYTKEHKNDFF